MKNLLWVASSAGLTMMASGCILYLLALFRNEWRLVNVGYGFSAAGFAVFSVFSLLVRDYAVSFIMAATAAFYAFLWWRNRRKGRRDKAARKWGAKSRALLQAMAARLKPSPIPVRRPI